MASGYGSPIHELSGRLGRLGLSLYAQARPQVWAITLLAGLVSYGAVNWALVNRGSLSLLPISLLIGSFLVPVVVVLWLQESGAACDMSPAVPTVAFLAGGVLGLLVAHILTPLFFKLPGSRLLMIGTSEEAAKLLAVLAVLGLPLGRACPSGPRAGLVLGASAGLGFAAMESMGMAFRSVFEQGYSQNVMDQILFARSLLGPLAHGTWTALLAAAVWPLRSSRGLADWLGALAAFAIASALHALWNLPRFLSVDLYHRFMAPAVPYLPLPVWHLAVGAVSLGILLVYVRGRLEWPRPLARHQVVAELQHCLELAGKLEEETTRPGP